MCETGETITVEGLGELDECPRLLLVGRDLQTCRQIRDLWRHWSKGNFGAMYPDAHESVLACILWFDDCVGGQK
jgi:hypothetical protein